MQYKYLLEKVSNFGCSQGNYLLKKFQTVSRGQAILIHSGRVLGGASLQALEIHQHSLLPAHALSQTLCVVKAPGVMSRSMLITSSGLYIATGWIPRSAAGSCEFSVQLTGGEWLDWGWWMPNFCSPAPMKVAKLFQERSLGASGLDSTFGTATLKNPWYEIPGSGPSGPGITKE